MTYRHSPVARQRNTAAAGYHGRRAPLIRYIPPVLLLAAILTLAGCASLSKEECLAADWYTIGVEDGSKGYVISRIGAHRKACAKVGVQPDMARYNQGRDMGLQQFCTAERGYREGERGARYSGVCPAHLEPTFMQGYLAGQQIYKINHNIRRLEGELAMVRQDTTDLRAKLDQGYNVDSAGKKIPIGKFERDAMYERLLALSKEEGRLEGEISTLRNSLSGA